MINLQLGRRNLSPTQISYFRGLRYNNENSDKTSNLSQNFPKGHYDLSGNTIDKRMLLQKYRDNIAKIRKVIQALH